MAPGGYSVYNGIRRICACLLGCILGIFAKKAPNLVKIGCFSAENGILKGPKIVFF